jgi:hypothetical protein
MRYLTYTLSLVAFAALTIAAIGPTSSNPITVQGHLIDTKCYGMGVNMDKPKMNYHNTHMVLGKDGAMQEMPNCATACANMGIPAGIVEGSEPGNTTYVLITPSNQLADHMDKEARVTGERAYEGGIIPNKIEVKEDGEWKEVKIATMM